MYIMYCQGTIFKKNIICKLSVLKLDSESSHILFMHSTFSLMYIVYCWGICSNRTLLYTFCVCVRVI